MQDPIVGGVYRNVIYPDGANISEKFNMSMENSFSLYAGLHMLENVLTQRMQVISQASGVSHAGRYVSRASISENLTQVSSMIDRNPVLSYPFFEMRKVQLVHNIPLDVCSITSSG